MQLKIRPVEAGDRAQWDGLWQGYLAYYETVLPPEMYDLAFDRLLQNDDHEFSGLVAEDSDGQLIGLTHYLYHRHGWKAAPVCYLQDLYVKPEIRGGGVGRKLIEAVYNAADTAGAEQVYWLTQDFNKPARLLYDKVATLTPFIKYQR